MRSICPTHFTGSSDFSGGSPAQIFFRRITQMLTKVPKA